MMEENRKKKRFQLNTPGKVITAIAFLVITAVLIVAGMCALRMKGRGAYDKSREDMEKEEIEHIVSSYAMDILYNYVELGDDKDAQAMCRSMYSDMNMEWIVYKNNVTVGGYSKAEEKSFYSLELEYKDTDFMSVEEGRGYRVICRVYEELSHQDAISSALSEIDFMYRYRYEVLKLIVIMFILCIGLFILLIGNAGKRAEDGTLQLSWVDRIPLDLFLVILLAGIYLLSSIDVFWWWGEDSQHYRARYFFFLLEALCISGSVGLVMLGGISFGLRCKTGHPWHNTLVRRIYVRIRQIVMLIGRNIPFIWKGILVFACISLVEFVVMGICLSRWSRESLLILFLFEKAILFVVLCLCMVHFMKLKQGSEKLAEGDLAYQIDTDRMCFDFAQFGENLNQIGQGMKLAVEERIKSERFKTELITNVSHDIKTPLTSIVNYVDLMSKEETDDPKIKEYLEVLIRQSARLKKLIEDLLEASKASTGAMEVHFERCEVGVLLTQAAGEYEEKLKENQLELLIDKPEEELVISADGRHLWRVFDNLLSNVNKYAQPGTRVYLDMEQQGGQVRILFRNISRCALHVSEEELQERFVRGDSSRHTEGSGLGLSIARSLTELMKGSFVLKVDGDLFKVILSFPEGAPFLPEEDESGNIES